MKTIKITLKNPENLIRRVIQNRDERRYHIAAVFLSFLVVALLLLPADDGLSWVLFQLLLSLLFLLGIFLTSKNRHTLLLACILAIPALEIGWVAVAAINPALYEYALILGICFVVVLLFRILSELLKVTKRKDWMLPAIISFFLLFILFWGILYLLLFLKYPDFFVFSQNPVERIGIADLFSLSCSTLLPAGHLSPVYTRFYHLSGIESLTGILCFLVISIHFFLIPRDEGKG